MRNLAKVVLIFWVLGLIFAANHCLAFGNNDPRNLLAKMERTMQEGARSPLQGAWLGQKGFESIVLLFTQNFCALGVGNQELYGTFAVRGNRLYLNLQDGRKLDFMYNLQGQTLILDNEIRLNFQPLNNQQMAFDRPMGGNNSFGGGFGPSPSSPMPGFGASNSLEGAWYSPVSDGTYSMIFSGNTYSFRFNNRESERGTFTYANGIMDYRIQGGRGVGKTGRYRVDLNGNMLTLTPPNGHSMTFSRR